MKSTWYLRVATRLCTVSGHAPRVALTVPRVNGAFDQHVVWKLCLKVIHVFPVTAVLELVDTVFGPLRSLRGQIWVPYLKCDWYSAWGEFLFYPIDRQTVKQTNSISCQLLTSADREKGFGGRGLPVVAGHTTGQSPRIAEGPSFYHYLADQP